MGKLVEAKFERACRLAGGKFLQATQDIMMCYFGPGRTSVVVRREKGGWLVKDGYNSVFLKGILAIVPGEKALTFIGTVAEGPAKVTLTGLDLRAKIEHGPHVQVLPPPKWTKEEKAKAEAEEEEWPWEVEEALEEL